MATITETLQKIGLSENETQIYISLLPAGNKTAAELARNLDLDKSSAYRACENLEKLGLIISSPKVRGTTYLAKSPETLNDIYQKQLHEVESLGGQLTQTIAELKTTSSKNLRNIQIFTEYGIEAVRKAMTESLGSKTKQIREWQQTGKKYYHDKEQVAFILDFAKKRIHNKVSIRQLESDHTFQESQFKAVMATDKRLFKEIRMMPSDFDDKNTLRIWDDTVNIISFDENEDYVVVTIKDKYIAIIIRNLFDFVWDKSEVY